MWDMWKKGFFAWESAAAEYTEQWMRSPFVLKPSGTILSTVMKIKTANDKAAATWLGAMGLPTKRDQERTLHALNELQSKLYDLEDRIEDLAQDAN